MRYGEEAPRTPLVEVALLECRLPGGTPELSGITEDFDLLEADFRVPWVTGKLSLPIHVCG
jgi:hypothetical protein